ncbi:MAG: hypothetical protein LKI39_07775 [Bacteroides sp.]|jgi:hypothetical protein|uniref:hypothetical protein n=1 Tax=Bacteroides sp. HPS0048 TaxID=1078089 RepID=UPI00035CB89E|nr:hypothetical protein [Bacteroides sp. HPS0048]EOA60616.1 hypothetical protein HMPREF1214_00130 [Bacteroides sp. HPS0048]MCI1646924.1 hypothetical protein [Bacteroides sp.]MCI1682440.1 hypothetical protein [Bacteroides sp.]
METKIIEKVDMILNDFGNEGIKQQIDLMFSNSLSGSFGVDGETIEMRYILVKALIDLFETRAKERAALIKNAE